MIDGTTRRITIRLLESILPGDIREALIGDLLEESEIRLRTSAAQGTAWWWWRQIASCVAQVTWWNLRRGHWLRPLGVAVVVYLAMSAVESIATAVVFKLLRPDTLLQNVLSSGVGFAAMLLGGYVAASIRRGAVRALAAIIFTVVAALLVTAFDSAPLWYGLMFLAVGPLAAFTGGAFHNRRHAR
jgi:hypothetical protein